MESWQLAGIVLLAVLVGVALPVLITLRSTLREARTFLVTVGQGTDRSLRELTATLEKVNHTYAQIEARAAHGAAPQQPGASGDSALAGVAAAVGALAAPALLEWLMTFIASRKAAAGSPVGETRNGG